MMKTALFASTAILLAAAPVLAQPQPPGGQPAARVTPQSPAPQPGSAASQGAARMTATQFIQTAQMSDRFEIGSSKLAQQQAQAETVKNFAAEMVRDHTRTTQELMDLAQRVQGGAQMSGAGGTRQGSGSGAAGDSTARAGAGTASPGGASGGSAGQGSAQTSAQARSQAGGAGMTTAQGGTQAEGLDAEHQQLMQRLQQARGAEFDRLYMQQQVQAHQRAVDMFTAYSQQGDNAELKQWAAKTLPALQQHLQRAQQLQRSL